MRQIIQTQCLQAQAQGRDIERIESQLETIRGSSLGKSDDSLEMTKKVMNFERELSQITKSHQQDMRDLKQQFKDQDLLLRNMRHTVEQGQASNEFKSQELFANQADSLQSLQLRTDSLERNIRKQASDQEVSHKTSLISLECVLANQGHEQAVPVADLIAI